MKIPHWYVVFRQFFQPYYIPNPNNYTAPIPKDEQPLTEKIAKKRQKYQKYYVFELSDDLKKLRERIKKAPKGSTKRKKLIEKRNQLREEYFNEIDELNKLREFLGLKPIKIKEVQKKQEQKEKSTANRADEISYQEAQKAKLEELELKKRPKFNRKEYKELIEKAKIWYKKNKKGKYDLKVNTYNYPRPLHELNRLDIKPELGTIFAYHDKNRHQVLGHFAPKSGYKYGKDTRSNSKRKSLFPLVFPKYVEDKPFDRTHLIPFGYHNSESDKRLLIGWDSWQNRNPLNEWELNAKNHDQNIYWLADIEKTENGADWHYRIFDENYNVIDRLDLSMGTQEEPISFVWMDGYYSDTEIWIPQKKVTVINHS